MDERELQLADGRTVRYFDSWADSGTDAALTVFWQHGTPQTGRLITPLASAAAARGIRLISCARPGYPGSSPVPERSVADAAAAALAVADALGIDRFATAGASGGGPHALACAALAPERVNAVVTLAGIAPFTEEFEWFAGMASDGGLRAARGGRDKRARYAETAEFDESSFTEHDWQALAGAWGALGEDAGLGSADGPGGEIDDDLAYVSGWGIELAVTANRGHARY